MLDAGAFVVELMMLAALVYVGIFLVGAYQEILGDLHNLFGDTNAVHIRITDRGYEITDLVHGDTVTEVLNYVQFRASDLLQTFRNSMNPRIVVTVPASGRRIPAASAARATWVSQPAGSSPQISSSAWPPVTVVTRPRQR